MTSTPGGAIQRNGNACPEYPVPDSNIDRLLAAFARKKSDRTPNFEIIVETQAVATLTGWPEPRARQSRFLEPADAVAFAKLTAQDAIVVCADAWIGQDAVREWADLEKIGRPDPGGPRRCLQQYLDAAAGTDIGVCAHMCAPFFVAYMAMGPVPIQSFMLSLHDDLPLVERLMDIQLENQLAIWEGIKDLPLSFAVVADDVAATSGYFCRPALMDEIWAPRAQRLARAVKDTGLPMLWHCCGKLDDVLPHLVDWGVDAINPVQPACNDIYRIKKDYGDRLCLVGNMSIEGVLAFGTPDEVAADTRQHIERLSEDGGYVVASSHCIIDGVPVDNYLAMIHAAQATRMPSTGKRR
ncbi:uroporphyrinogen decarboxylase family protein [Verrucomicrobiota bacterium]